MQVRVTKSRWLGLNAGALAALLGVALVQGTAQAAAEDEWDEPASLAYAADGMDGEQRVDADDSLWVEDELIRTRMALRAAEDRLERQQRRLRALEMQLVVQASRDDDEQLLAAAAGLPIEERPSPLAAIENGFELSIQFRSGSYEIEPHYQAQLDRLGAALASLPGLRVVVHGFSDPRGPQGRNYLLSNQRVAMVRSALEQAGLDGGRIDTHGFGETQPLDLGEDSESFGFERRVVLTFAAEQP